MAELKEETVETIQEAREDLIDAIYLASRGSNARAAAAYHAEQAAEKSLRALCDFKGVQANWQWDIEKLWESLQIQQDELTEKIRLLANYSTPTKNGVDEEALNGVLQGAKDIVGFVFEQLDMEMEPLPEVQQRRPRHNNSRHVRNNRGKGRGRSLLKKNSYVKRFYICPVCGVKIPFKRQTASGHVRCPHCGGPMKLMG